MSDARIVDRDPVDPRRHPVHAGDDRRHRRSENGERPHFITGRVTGAQTGAVLAFISSGILGQYDPFAGDGGELLLVYPNVIAVERQLRVLPADFRLWVCLHEVTHRVQFRANPWLADHMSNALAVLTEETGEDVTEVIGRLANFVRDRRDGVAAEPNSVGDPRRAAGGPVRAAAACTGPVAGAGHAAGRSRRPRDGRRRAGRGAVGGHHPPPVRRTAPAQATPAATGAAGAAWVSTRR